MVQYATLRDWPDDIERMARGETQRCTFPIESPEIIAEINRYELEPELRDDPAEAYYYRMFVGVDTSIAAGADGVSGTGPGLLLYPTLQQIRQLARGLKAEADLVDLLEDESGSESSG